MSLKDYLKENQNLKVFLGGTCNNSKWRDLLISKLEVDYFNPVVDNWTIEDQYNELKQRDICDYLLYVITPKMKGVYSIAEVVEDSIKNTNKTIFCFLEKDEQIFDEAQIKSLNSVGQMIKRNGAIWLNNLDEIANYLNSR